MIKIATPVSDLFDTTEAPKIRSISDIFELRDNVKNVPKADEYLYHVNLNMLGKWATEDISMLKNMKDKYNIISVSAHLISLYQHGVVEKGIRRATGKPYAIGAANDNMKENVNLLKSIFGEGIEILVENVPYYNTRAYRKVTDASFISSIIKKHKVGLLLDIPHILVTSINRKYKCVFPDQYLKFLPLSSCKQIHISGYTVKNGFAYDAHNLVSSVVWTTLKLVLCLTDSVEYVSIEYYDNKEKLYSQLKILKEMLHGHN